MAIQRQTHTLNYQEELEHIKTTTTKDLLLHVIHSISPFAGKGIPNHLTFYYEPGGVLHLIKKPFQTIATVPVYIEDVDCRLHLYHLLQRYRRMDFYKPGGEKLLPDIDDMLNEATAYVDVLLREQLVDKLQHYQERVLLGDVPDECQLLIGDFPMRDILKEALEDDWYQDNPEVGKVVVGAYKEAVATDTLHTLLEPLFEGEEDDYSEGIETFHYHLFGEYREDDLDISPFYQILFDYGKGHWVNNF